MMSGMVGRRIGRGRGPFTEAGNTGSWTGINKGRDSTPATENDDDVIHGTLSALLASVRGLWTAINWWNADYKPYTYFSKIYFDY